MSSRNLLFAEPLCTETGLWCELADGIDPARWAEVAWRLGELSPNQFEKAKKCLFPDPDSLKSRLKRMFTFEQADCAILPLICIGKLKDDCDIKSLDSVLKTSL